MNKVKIKNIFIGLMTILGFILFYLAVNASEKRNIAYEKYKKETNTYNDKYVKENPEMISVINNYMNCEHGFVYAVEGCIKYTESRTTKENMNKLKIYLDEIDKIKSKFLNDHKY